MTPVLRRVLKPLACAVIFNVTVGPAHAVVVDGKFTGRVSGTFVSSDGKTITSDVPNPGGVSLGDQVTGYFTYDTDGATDQHPSDPTHAQYLYSPAGKNSLSIEIKGRRWASGKTLSIEVENNRIHSVAGSPSPNSTFTIQFLDGGSSFPGNQLAGEGSVAFQIAVISKSAPNTLLKSDLLPTELSDINISEANAVAVYVLSDYPTYPPGRYGFFVAVDPGSVRLTPRRE